MPNVAAILESNVADTRSSK